MSAPALVDDPDAIGIAVARQSEIGAQLQDLGLEIDDVVGILRVGQVIGEASVRLAVELDDLAADAAAQVGP